MKGIKDFIRKNVLAGVFAALCISLTVTPVMTGCSKPVQQNVATLAQVLGTSAAQVAALEGNQKLADQITNDTNAAVQAITMFVPGSTAQNVIELINIVMADLSLVPVIGPYAGLIDLALGTAEALIADFSTKSPTPTTQMAVRVRVIHLPHPPKSRAEYVHQWNLIANANPQLAAAAIK